MYTFRANFEKNNHNGNKKNFISIFKKLTRAFPFVLSNLRVRLCQ